jgi:hypothetical protein
MMSDTKRAAKGGEFGANGDWYEGGKFINTVPENSKKRGSRPPKPRRQQVAPYVWEVIPEGKVSLYAQMAGAFGKVIDGVFVVNCSQQTLDYFGRTLEEVEIMARAWNEGVRLIDKTGV